ncbi:hypothetical protein F4604DRAFT_1977115 [Suillus subluteus]|nr:hypothetical protein F4604DRAFT_1977115 [Suillus subluteus]
MEDGDGGSHKFAPFASELDWRIARWAVQEGIGHKSFDRLMAIPGVSTGMSLNFVGAFDNVLWLSYHNVRGLHKMVDSIPPHAKCKTRELWYKSDPDNKHIIHYRDPKEVISALLGNPAHAKDIVYCPRKIFTDSSKMTRIYNEMWTGEWWNTVQGATLAPVIITTDKTQLMQYSGNKTAYPVYMTLGNLPRSLRRGPSQHACVLVAYLSVSKSVGQELTKKHKSAHIQQIFHDSMHFILEPLKEAGKHGIEVVFGDGYVRRVYPILTCYVADYPEQCLVMCAKYGTCPKCMASENDLGKSEASRRRAHNFQDRCKQHLISGAVTQPFWDGFPLCNTHLSITPDILHQLYQGKGWSELSQVSGKERKDMARILLGCLISKAPSQVVLCYRAILDFVYIAQYPSHDDNTLHYLDYALKLFHDNKHILTDPNLVPVREHLNIPKFHTMLHYAQVIRDFRTTDNYNIEMFERFHIDCAKEGWRASNFRDEVPQMVQWLARQEKGPKMGISISKRPSALNQPLASVQSKHYCPLFSHHLIHYLNQFLNCSQGQAIPRSQLHSTQLPFNNISVWHAFKFRRDTLGNDIDGSQEFNAVKAKPRRGIDALDYKVNSLTTIPLLI